MRTFNYIVIISIAAVIGFFVGILVNQAMDGAILFAMIAGFAYLIQAIESKKEP